jgi:hypothetical protein
LAIGFSQASSLYDVVAKGSGPPIVPYEGTGVVYKIRVLDLVTIYADEESRPIPDKLSSVGLVATATMALMALLLLTAARSERRLRRFYLLLTLGIAYLAADELFAFHETIGHNLRFLTDLPGVERPDDLVFLSYALPVGVFAWLFRDIFLAHRLAVQLLVAGAAFFAIATVGDIVGVGVDEPAEVVASVLLLAGLIVLTARTLTRELGLAGPEREPVPAAASSPALPARPVGAR